MILSRLGWAVAGLLVLIVILFVATTRVEIAPFDTPSKRQPADGVNDADMSADGQAADRGDGSGMLVVPVAGVARRDLTPNFADPREGGARRHEGLDIMADRGTPVLAAAPGRIDRLYFSEGGGGVTIYERSADGRRTYYYAHLDRYAPDLREGQRVRAGQWIANVGDSGNAGAGNYHLHFGVWRRARGDGWWRGTPIDPYPLLVSEPAGAH
ncbi:M23 family metallopeptidase [Stakelama saccharophila]|uniref:M23 family metallopeptidase n=1 Tax=Stakelama saccharophila TaxID=3075605 RepID=A0ABZ0BC83_9SPHN|nr:M23 family metallopeptidase [Stakelama sp. W311]WNO55004.1 M23 family metallopeptidase [Stakelama sp. W311]